jgi:pSer/pThr/pTyr-binding forkhead associated (FHA) protein
MDPDAPAGEPYLRFPDHRGQQRVFALPESWTHATIGRTMDADLVLSWDPEVSGVHAELQRIGGDWVLIDDGLSRNGSFVNGERVSRRRRLRDGDELRVGETTLAFCNPFQVGQETMVAKLPPELRTDEARRD